MAALLCYTRPSYMPNSGRIDGVDLGRFERTRRLRTATDRCRRRQRCQGSGASSVAALLSPAAPHLLIIITVLLSFLCFTGIVDVSRPVYDDLPHPCPALFFILIVFNHSGLFKQNSSDFLQIRHNVGYDHFSSPLTYLHTYTGWLDCVEICA